MAKAPFASFRARGYRVERLHVIGRAQAAYLTHRSLPPLYAVRYRMQQAASCTLRGAIYLCRARILPSRH